MSPVPARLDPQAAIGDAEPSAAEWWRLECHEQHALARRIAANIGYDLIPEKQFWEAASDSPLGDLADWLRREAAATMDTGYRGSFKPTVEQLERWVAELEAAQTGHTTERRLSPRDEPPPPPDLSNPIGGKT